MSLYSSLFLLFGALLAGLLTYLQYKDFFLRNRNIAILLSLLRWFSYVLVLLLLVNFQLKSSTNELQKQRLILLSDASTSMHNFSTEEEIKPVLNQFLGQRELQKKFDIQLYSFGESLSEIEDAQKYVANQSQTNISKALKEIHSIYRNQDYRIVLISDGNQSIGEDYTYAAKQLNQSIFPLVVGDTTIVEDLKIDRINNNNYVFLDNKFPVEVFVSYEGKESFSSTIKIKNNGKEVARQSVEFSPSKTAHRLALELLASKKGVQKYEVSLEAFEGEAFLKNNTIQTSIEVIDDFSRILILTDKIHPDLGMLQRSLEKSKRRKVETSLLSTFDGDLGDYNLLIFYQPTQSFSVLVEKAKKWGINILIFTGTKTDYAFVQEQFPFFEKAQTNATEDFYPLVNEKFSIFQQEDIGFASFPPLQDSFGEITTKGNTTSLLYQQLQGFATDSPMLFFTENEGKRYGFFMGENTWRWRSQYYVDHKDFFAFDDFIGRVIQYLTASTTKKRLFVDVENLYTNKLESELKATFFDANYELDNTVQLSIRLTNRNTKETTYYPMLWKGSYFSFPLKNIDSAPYEFEISVTENEFKYSGNFTLEDEDRERRAIRPDLVSLKSVAYKSQLFLLPEAAFLTDYLIQEEAFKPSLKTVKKNQSLIDWQYLLFFLIVSLSAEWFIRKYNGLT